MWVTSHRKNAIEIEDNVIKRVLGLYPEEKLIERDVFKDAYKNGFLSFADLKDESQKILIPWQMFFLTNDNLKDELNHIEDQRKHKISAKLIAKRKGSGNVTSKRIIDRLIRQQNFLLSLGKFSNNRFCGSLKGLDVDDAVKHIIKFFNIDRDLMWWYKGKKKALDYLISKVEEKNVIISRGVLSNKILPSWQVVPGDIYKNTSGFVIKDECVPFIFLPSETNPDEVEGRQIYTLIYLLVVIGLEEYDYSIETNLVAKMLQTSGVVRKMHNITTELLIPKSEVEALRTVQVTEEIRDTVSNKLKVTPSALIITLRFRDIISQQECDELKPVLVAIRHATGHPRNPLVSTSVRKFCGEITTKAINDGLRSGVLTSVQAQHLIWGMPNKAGMIRYKAELKI